MALPHMPTSYTTRKNIYEAAIVRRRNHENDFHENWSKNARYFNQSGITVTKQKAWTSDHSFQASMDAWKSTHEKEVKALNLKRRRLKLSELLQNERDQYQAELKGMSKENYARIKEMKDEAEGLRSAREEKRKRIAEEKLYEHWKLNSADLRKVESEIHKDHVLEGWGSQVDEKREREIEARLEKERFERELEEKRLIALDREKKEKERKFIEEQKMRNVLKEQVMELKEREAEAVKLKQQQDMLMKEQWELGNLEEQRKKMEEQRKGQELGRILLRQHSAQLRRKSRQIQEELELDRQILEALLKQEIKDQEIQTARREKARADASWMKQVIEEQIRVEKAREAELDMLYQDEAARVWQARETEWAKERQARARLMKEVMEGRQEQIYDKIEQVRQEQEESVIRREELIREMEIANQLTEREKEDREAAILARRDELDAQVTSRKEADYNLKLQLQQELEEEKDAEEDYEELLRKEAEQLRIRGFEPKIHSRRQAWQ